jgi:hypothetical protein
VGCTGGTPAPAPAASAQARPAELVTDADGRRDAGVDAATTLAADVAARTESVRAHYGAATRVEVVGGTFVLAEVGLPSPLFDQARALVARALPPLFDGRFSRYPDAAVTVLCFGSGDAYRGYHREHFGERTTVDWGVYRRGARELAVDLSRGAVFLPTLTHEMVHPLLQGDFPDAPLWLDEGIASLFEAPTFGADGSIHGQARNWRHDALLAGLASPADRADLRLDALFGMSPRDFKGDPKRNGDARAGHLEALNYALARSVCAWLDAQGKLWPFYRAWRDGVAADANGERAFASVMGAAPRSMNETWLRWAR